MPLKLSENKGLWGLLSRVKNPKILLGLGIIGMLLILVSSLFPHPEKKVSEKKEMAYISPEEYCDTLEKSIQSIVTEITGSKDSIVVVTLESGVRYSYAREEENTSSNMSGSSSSQESNSESNSYITVKASDGSEQALLVTEYMPSIRGVAIVCFRGNDEQIAEKIKGAVTAALNITAKRVYITGGTV